MPRRGLDTAAIVTAAAEIADAQGVDAVTLARVADRLGVRAPSLYVHLTGLGELRRLLAAVARASWPTQPAMRWRAGRVATLCRLWPAPIDATRMSIPAATPPCSALRSARVRTPTPPPSCTA